MHMPLNMTQCSLGGISVSGKDKSYFARSRTAWLARCLARDCRSTHPSTAMDLGCGIGSATSSLLNELKLDSLLGVDASVESLAIARRTYHDSRVRRRWFILLCAPAVSPPAARRLLRKRGFQMLRTDFLFFFPRFLAWLRPLESGLVRLPLGAQYQILCQKPERQGVE